MKSTGIIRRFTSNRLTLPREILEKNEIDAVEIFVEGDKIILKKYAPGCIFCGDAEDVVHFKDKIVCKNCKEELT